MSLLSFNTYASSLNVKAIDGQDALQIVDVLESLNIHGERNGHSDSGHVNIKVYTLFNMECETAYTAYGGYGSELVGACYFDKVQTKAQFNTLKLVLKQSGLNPKNKIFRYRFQE